MSPNSMDRRSIALVGYGRRGRGTILPALVAADRTPGWIVDTDSAARARAMHDVRDLGLGNVVVASNVSEVKADVVVIAVPHSRHRELVLHCAREGRAVLKEKPFAVSLEEGEMLPTLPGGSSVQILTTRNHRGSWPRLVELAGSVDAFRYSYRSWRLPENYRLTWRNDPDMAGGGVMIDLGYHVFDAAIRLFGPISAVSHLAPPTRRSGYQVEEEVSLKLVHSTGIVGRVDLSRVASHDDEVLLVEGMRGHVLSSRSGLYSRGEAGMVMRSYPPDPSGDVIRSLESALAVVGDDGERTHNLSVTRCISDAYVSMPKLV